MTEAAIRVLYIDDDPGLRRLAERALVRRGYQVTLADGGQSGVAIAAAQPFDLVAVDHYMPVMDGLETLHQLRALPDPPPIVYVTGSEEGQIAVAALKAGAADYVVKTVGENFFDLLASSFNQVVAHARLMREKEAAEVQLRASNARLATLLKEVNHRVANSLQLVSTLVHLQANALADPAARAALQDTQRRIAAIGQVHRRLYTNDDVENVDMRDYLAALIEELADTWSTDDAPRQVTLSADPITLPTDRAVALGVIVNELVSNACKYAYATNTAGSVRVALKRLGARFELSVEDDGIGITPGAVPSGTGLGTRVVRAMAQSLQSTITYDPAHRGVRATLNAALR
ncbi:sensor histidine kinase [Sphingomonas sp. 28-63-12]|uniref:sensor histidine kinase n=1 Tax=Sphingomonas sp. 28-63-12 TaxID=1970434 RepID=UPI000BCA76BF|nr:MAG: two-component system sensor histidine kinase/response regulator [Sphingomonas sp. 28-63-12]